jgi:hypothetical protein
MINKEQILDRFLMEMISKQVRNQNSLKDLKTHPEYKCAVKAMTELEKKVLKVSSPFTLDFVCWYSGMKPDSIQSALKRFYKERYKCIPKVYTAQETVALIQECCGEVSCDDGCLLGKSPEDLVLWLLKKRLVF